MYLEDPTKITNQSAWIVRRNKSLDASRHSAKDQTYCYVKEADTTECALISPGHDKSYNPGAPRWVSSEGVFAIRVIQATTLTRL